MPVIIPNHGLSIVAVCDLAVIGFPFDRRLLPEQAPAIIGDPVGGSDESEGLTRVFNGVDSMGARGPWLAPATARNVLIVVGETG